MTPRAAVLADRFAMLRMARAFSEAHGFADLPFDPAWVEAQIKRWIAGDGGMALVVENIDGMPVAMLCADLGQGLTAPYPVAHLRVFWIDPAARGGATALRMGRAFMAWAHAADARVIGAAVPRWWSGAALFTRLGLAPGETHHVWIG